MKSRIFVRAEASARAMSTLHTVPVFPRPSRQLLEGIGFVRPARSLHSCCRLYADAPKRQRISRHASTPPKPAPTTQPSQAAARLDALLTGTLQLLQSQKPPKEGEVLKSLGTCEQLALSLKTRGNPSPQEQESGSTGLLTQLSFLEEGDTMTAAHLALAEREAALRRLSETAYKIVKDPKVFITAQVLKSYVNTQALLGRPESFAEVFELYANKPVPLEGSSPIKFSPAQPNRASSAVPSGTATIALDAAIQARKLPLCLDIISSTAAKPAFHRSKFIQKGLLPVTAFFASPVAAYIAASQFAIFSDKLEPGAATNIAFAGIISYLGFTGVIGYVALTTANDQMDRVTWAPGMPLRQRWVREDERAMFDKIAQAWGFRESFRRGEEQGPEWEALRDLLGLRGMILDSVELMEGMQ